MKTSIRTLMLLVVAPAFLGAATSNPSTVSAHAPAVQNRATTVIQVTVNTPPSARPWASDDLAEAFTVQLSDTLKERGFKGQIKYLDSLDTPQPQAPMLTINLVELRRDRIGNFNCTFSAEYAFGNVKKQLGLFTGTAMGVIYGRGSAFAREEQVDEAIEQAITDLYSRMTSTGLLSA